MKWRIKGTQKGSIPFYEGVNTFAFNPFFTIIVLDVR